MKKIFYLLLFLAFGCEKAEIPISDSIGELQSFQINMESDYKNQIYYNLENNQVVKQNLKTEWDLAFEASEEGWEIITNSARFAKVSELINHNFQDFTHFSSWILPSFENSESFNDFKQSTGIQ